MCFRCESHNSVIRSRNVYSNRQAPSKDMATAFAVQGSIRFTFSSSCYNTSEGLIFLETGLIVKLNFFTCRCGEDLVSLYNTKEEVFLDGEVQECGSGIHKHGTLQKVII